MEDTIEKPSDASVPTPGLSHGVNLAVNKEPLIQLAEGARITIGDNVTLNSNNNGYHLTMFAPIKLMADRPGAVIEIGDNTRIHGSCLHAYARISIGKRCLIAANTQIFDANGHEPSFDNVSNRINTSDQGRPITIGDDVWIGAHCLILPGVTIGNGSIIAAGSVVRGEVPPMVVVAGNPAQIVKRF